MCLLSCCREPRSPTDYLQFAVTANLPAWIPCYTALYSTRLCSELDRVLNRTLLFNSGSNPSVYSSRENTEKNLPTSKKICACHARTCHVMILKGRHTSKLAHQCTSHLSRVRALIDTWHRTQTQMMAIILIIAC